MEKFNLLEMMDMSVCVCLLCKRKTVSKRKPEQLVHTAEGLDKLRQAVTYLGDKHISNAFDGANYHLHPCYANYTRRANRVKDKLVTGQDALQREDLEAIDVIIVDESPPRCSSRSRNISNPKSVNKDERPCMICDKKRAYISKGKVMIM